MSDERHYMPGEPEAIETVIRLGMKYGYGNLISELMKHWSTRQQLEGVSKSTADLAAGLVCAWCHTDHRTGKKTNP